METQILTIREENRNDVIEKAARTLQEGKVVAIPTETVYGLAANALNSDAVKAIFEAKGRPFDNPMIVHVSNLVMLREIVENVPERAIALIKRFWPGPLTIVLPGVRAVSPFVTGSLDTVAVRMPSHPVAADIIEYSGFPLAAPSANLSGRPSPTTARHVMEDLGGLIPLIIDDGICQVGLESTVLSLADETPVILRPGMVTLSQIREILAETVYSDEVYSHIEKEERVLSPGLKYMHYSPRASVTVIEGTLEQFAEYARKNASHDTYAMCFDGEEIGIDIPSVSYGEQDRPDMQARRLFSALRAIDQFGATSVFVRCPSSEGESLAVYNRLVRAAGNRVIKL